MAERSPAAPRCAAIVGPYLTGKTTLLESLLFATGAVGRKGSAREGNTVGDGAAEARARKMSVEVSAASAEFLGGGEFDVERAVERGGMAIGAAGGLGAGSVEHIHGHGELPRYGFDGIGIARN